MNEVSYIFRLSMVEGIGPQRIRKLKNRFKSAENVFNASAEELCKVDGINIAVAEKILGQTENNFVDAQLEQCGLLRKLESPCNHLILCLFQTLL